MAQNRERVFMVSILRTEAELTPSYNFPQGFPLDKCLADILECEETIDKSFFFEANCESINNEGRYSKLKQIGQIYDKIKNPARGRIYSPNGLSPTIVTPSGGHSQPKTICLNSKDKNGKQPSLGDRVYATDGISTAITVGWHPKIYSKNKCRLLTPTEVLRLMDVDDSDIEKMKAAGIAKTTLYRLAGNSIVVSCLYHIFRTMFIPGQPENERDEIGRQLTIFDVL